LRGGRIVGEGDPRDLTTAALAEMMVGRPVRFNVEKTAFQPGETLLEVSGLSVLRDSDELAVDDVSLAVHSGEVVGIAGVQCNGQSALIEAITGLGSVAAGQIRFLGTDITRAPVRARHRMGMAHIPEDRQRAGLIAEFTVAENMVLDSYYDAPFSTRPQIDWSTVRSWAAWAAVAFDVRTPSVFARAGHLSGGNQQKLIVARELSHDTKLVIAAQPTRGLDVGSIEYIHARLMAARAEGAGVLIVSSELDEILALSDRILVMFKGRIVAEYDATTTLPEKSRIGLAMAGVAA
ncbi:MAG TPA: ATP-binding cassette domain-containing protein, partial [Paracoccaceae bacterium]|nr:ATP-binding cassette domain-containing protein [Paracoccaceae bacterium]